MKNKDEVIDKSKNESKEKSPEAIEIHQTENVGSNEEMPKK